MGKFLSSSSAAAPSKIDANNGNGKCNASTETSTTKYSGVGSGNVLIYVLCVTTLGFSVYTSMSNVQLEHRIRNYHRLDERISLLEAKLRIFPIQFLQSLASSSSSSAQLPSKSSDNRTVDGVDVLTPEAIAAAVTTASTVNDDDDDGNDNESNETADEFANMVRKLSVQISGIQRLRRDVTYLKASRRGERQASVQQTTECMCPPGKINVSEFPFSTS